MEEIKPWHSLSQVDRVLSETDEGEVREWLAAHWNRDFLAAEPAAVRRLLPLLDLSRVKDRAATVLFAAERDWVDALEAAAELGCGFTPAFWREAFERARTAGSVRCIAWMLANRADDVAGLRGGALEL